MPIFQSKFLAKFASLDDAFIRNDDNLAADRRATLIGRFLTGFFGVLITGNYFAGLLIAMGADDVFIGAVSMVTTLCGCIQFLSPLILERLPRRKALVMWLRGFCHILNIAVLGIIPLLPISGAAKLGWFMATLIILNLLTSFYTPAFNIWQLQCLPTQKHNSFFTVLNVGNTIINVLTTYCESALLDHFEAEKLSLFGISPTVTAILILRAAALICAAVEMICFARMKEFPYANDKSSGGSAGLLLLIRPLFNRRFMLTVMIMLLYNYAASIVCNFFNVYLIDVIDLSYTFMSLWSMVWMPLALLVMPVWSKQIRRFGWEKVLPVGLGVFSIAYFLNAIVTAETVYIVYPIIQLVCQLGYPCVSLVFSYLTYVNMPEENRTVYLSFYALCSTAVTFLGSATGTLFMTVTHGKIWTVFGFSMMNYQYINLLQFVLMIGVVMYTICARKHIENPSAKV